MTAYLSFSRHKQVACLSSLDAGRGRICRLRQSFAEVVNVKTSVDSVSKQVNSRIEFVVLQSMTVAAVTRRYIAGKGSYVCSHAETDLLPQTNTGSTVKSAAGKTQCVLKSQPGVDWLCSIA